MGQGTQWPGGGHVLERGCERQRPDLAMMRVPEGSLRHFSGREAWGEQPPRWGPQSSLHTPELMCPVSQEPHRQGTDAFKGDRWGKETLGLELFFCLLSFVFFRAEPAAYGGSQAGGQIGATAAGLHHSHSNAGSEPRLRPTPQLTAALDP